MNDHPSVAEPTANRKQQEARFRTIFRRIHAHHPNCLRDEWLTEPCRFANGRLADRPIVWSRRNGPWQHSEVLWIGSAPGNAGGKGGGPLGAHGTRIPFGGDIAGGNLDVLMASIGLDRNRTFITATLNQLPRAGGGEPTLAELRAPVGEYPSSLHIVRDTLIAVGPKLLVVLGNTALRAVFAAVRITQEPKRLPSLKLLQESGLVRNRAPAWPTALTPDEDFQAAWKAAWPRRPLPHVLWLIHPSAQNMSPYAGRHTVFHQRMRTARTALRRAARNVLGYSVPRHRAPMPGGGIYALPEWRELIGPRHQELSSRWRERGI